MYVNLNLSILLDFFAFIVVSFGAFDQINCNLRNLLSKKQEKTRKIDR